MKKFLLTVVGLIFFPFGILSSQSCNIDTLKYIRAYEYIKNDSIFRKNNLLMSDISNQYKSINVSTYIFDLDRFWHSSGLKDYPNEQQLVNHYRQKKGFVWDKSYYSICLDKLFGTKHKYEDFILFFSSVEDNILVANLIPIKKEAYDINNYDKIASFTEVYSYLFLFNPDKSIKKVLNSKIFYD